MKILVVTHYFWPENFRINDLVDEWLSKGHDVIVLTGKPNYPLGNVFPEYLECPANFTRYKGAKVVRVPMLARSQGSIRLFLNFSSFVLGASFFGWIKLRGFRPDVIFVYEPSPVTVGLPAILLGKIKKTPVVFWVLDLWPETLSAIGVVKSPKLLGYVGRLVSFIYNHCELVLAQSKGFIGGIGKYRSEKTGIRYFPSWAEPVFTDSSASPAPEVTSRPDAFNIVFAGNIGEAQDLPSVLKAAAILKSEERIQWWIVGDGRQYAWLISAIKAQGLENTIHLLGRFPVERMPSFYSAASVLLVSLKKDPVFSLTIPGKIQSYLLSGVPILGMLDGEGAVVIEEAEAGKAVAAGDYKSLAKTALELANTPSEILKIWGANGRSYAEREFDRRGLMARLESMLNEAALAYKKKG